MRRSIVALALFAVAALPGAIAAPAPGRAQEAITVLSDEPTNDFPTGVTFRLTFRAPGAPKDVRLRYELAPDGTGASATAQCTGTGTVSCTYTLTSGRGIFIIPGAEITWHWDIEDDAGNRLSTEDRLYVHEDTRFTFETLSSGNVTVYYHPGTGAQAPDVLDAAVETLASAGALEGAQVGFPVKVFVYRTAEEMQPAIAPAAGRGVQILGEVVYSDTAMVSVDGPALDIVRHEVAHIVTREATKGPFGVPDWMNEGISVFSQRRPLAGHQEALDRAVERDRVLSMKELRASSLGDASDTVSLYYGQAGAIIRFIVDTYGEEKFRQLIQTFRDGATPDDAFETVFGVDELGLENAWRESVGLGPREASATPTPRPTEEARAQPTSARDDDGAPAGAGAGGDDGGVPVVTIVLVLALVAAVAAAGAGAYSVARSRL